VAKKGVKEWSPIDRERACFDFLGVDDWDGAFVKLAYGDSFDLPVRSLRFITERIHPVPAAALIRLIEGYNEFVGDDVAAAVLRLHEEGRLMSVEFGRESSPVLYLYMAFWTNQRSNAPPGVPAERLSESEMNENRTVIMEAMRALQADEIDLRYQDTAVRAWWD
jgi:hypothetical protein